MDTFYVAVVSYFDELLQDIKCQPDTRAYIVSIFGKYKVADHDLSKDSITLLFAQARLKNDFSLYQGIADWIFFAQCIADKHLKYASKDYYDLIGRSSYYSCYKILNRKWKLFEELSDNFIDLEFTVKEKLKHLYI